LERVSSFKARMKPIYLFLALLLSSAAVIAQNSKPYLVGPKSKQSVPGQGTCLSIQSMDQDAGDTVRISWSTGIQTATFTNNNGTVKHASGEICWTPGDADTSRMAHEFYITLDDGKEQVTDTFYIYVRGMPERLTYTKTEANCGEVSVAITVNDWTSNSSFVIRDSLFKTVASSKGPSASFRLPKGTYKLYTQIQSNTPSMRTYLDTLIVSDGIGIRAYKQSNGQGNYALEPEVIGESVKSYAWFKIVNGNKEDLHLNTETIQVNSWNTETFRVIVTANSGCVDSADFEFQASPNGLKTMHHQASIYPNPANQSLNVFVENGQLSGLELWSLDGKLLKEEKAVGPKKYQLEISEIPNGIYLVKCFLEDGAQENFRVVIQH